MPWLIIIYIEDSIANTVKAESLERLDVHGLQTEIGSLRLQACELHSALAQAS